MRSNLLAMLTGQLITWVLTATTLALLPRYLGAETLGSYRVGVTISGLVTALAVLGIPTIVMREVARQREEAAGVVSTAVGGGFVLVVAASMLATAGSFLAGYRGVTLAAIAASCATAPFTFLITVGLSTFNGFEVMRRSATVEVLTKVLTLITAVCVIWFDLGIYGLLCGAFICVATVSVIQMYLIRRVIPVAFSKMSIGTARLLLHDGVPFTAIAIGFTLYTAVDVLLLSVLSGERAVGIYSVPAHLFGTMLFLPVILVTVVFPRMAEKAVTSPDELAHVVRVVLKVTITFSVAASLLAVAVSDELLITVLGPDFERAKPLVVVMALSVAPTSIGIIASRIVFATDRQSAMSLLSLGGFVGKILLGLWMIPLFDRWFQNPALGSAVGLLCTEVAMTAALARFLPRSAFDRGMRSFLVRSSVATAAGVPVLLVLLPTSPLLASLTALAVFLGFNLVLRAYPLTEITGAARWALGRQLQSEHRSPAITSSP